MRSSSLFSEEDSAEEDTWRRVWKVGRRGIDGEHLARCLIELLKEP